MSAEPGRDQRQDDDQVYSPRSGPKKVVSIADPETSPTIMSLDNQSVKQFPAGLARRLSGRPAASSNASARNSLANLDELPAPAMRENGGAAQAHSHDDHAYQKLLSQVSGWLQAEKAKRAADRAHDRLASSVGSEMPAASLANTRSASVASDRSAISLERLQLILDDHLPSSSLGLDGNVYSSSPRSTPRRPSLAYNARRKSSLRGNRTASSDTEYQDSDVVVPSCDVLLDNSKTLSYAGGASASTTDVTLSAAKSDNRKAWSIFKTEVLKLTHTLRLKGWRRVALDRGDDIVVTRLSGALTNAVYVVLPPKHVPDTIGDIATAATSIDTSNATPTPQPRRPPPKLLLRIYGPQVEHLIDRENELGILRRLARKRIGPRMLGTFRNGRFEEYFDSMTLTSNDLRVPETSKQIAKRMRELHEGIDLLQREREEGPFVWRNWDKWVARCELVVKYLDARTDTSGGGGYVCGVQWKLFRAMVEKYRVWLTQTYGNEEHLKDKLVFAHNDTQYGNILRLVPATTSSPLLLPANTHKQLVVIDFEYASANTPGLEFANHFTEWCYNYHDARAPHACRTDRYPTEEEQRRFIRAYISHRPQFNAEASMQQTPKLGPRTESAVGSIREFMLDSRTPGGTPGTEKAAYDFDEERRIRALEIEVDEMIKETRRWRVANSAQWVAWGIVQAKVPGLDEDNDAAPNAGNTADGTTAMDAVDTADTHDHPDKRPEGLIAEVLLQENPSKDQIAEARQEEAEDGDDEFDYLGYARERALFFWGDCVELGLVTREELPGDVRDALKIIAH